MTHKNVSTILPGTTHVTLPIGDFLLNSKAIETWFHAASGRTDLFAWEGDDPLDHFHYKAFINQASWQNYPAPDVAALTDWADMLHDNGDDADMLFAFADAATAMLFKLTFGGAA